MAQKKPALGRGLDALFRDSSIEVPVKPTSKVQEEAKSVNASPENAILYIDIDEIKPNKNQPRFKFDDEAINNLAESIYTHGVLQPVMLKKATNGFELVAGERRWRAARKAGLKEIPAIVRDLSEEENALFAIVENTQREDLNPIEEANAYRMIIDEFGMTQDSVAKNVGKSRPYIANLLRVLKLPDEIRTLIEEGKLTVGHANALGMIGDKDTQITIAHQVVKNGSSVRETERIAGGLESKTKKPINRKNIPDKPNFSNIEEELTSMLGTRVLIDGSEHSGSLHIKYYSKDQLDGIIDDLRKLK